MTDRLAARRATDVDALRRLMGVEAGKAALKPPDPGSRDARRSRLGPASASAADVDPPSTTSSPS
jgi:hypothetical protein